MKFSIIVPVYNVEKYLPRCLDSVLDQEFDDYEIIAVDDESPDNSIDILNEYQKKTEKLKIIRQKNKGLGGARNTGIKEAAGEYLIFLDSDDYISPKMLSSLNEYLKKEDLDILAFDCERVTESGQTIEKVSVKDYQDQYTSDKEISDQEWQEFVAEMDVEWNNAITELCAKYQLSKEELHLVCLSLVEFPFSHLEYLLHLSRATLYRKRNALLKRIDTKQDREFEEILQKIR